MGAPTSAWGEGLRADVLASLGAGARVRFTQMGRARVGPRLGPCTMELPTQGVWGSRGRGRGPPPGRSQQTWQDTAGTGAWDRAASPALLECAAPPAAVTRTPGRLCPPLSGLGGTRPCSCVCEGHRISRVARFRVSLGSTSHTARAGAPNLGAQGEGGVDGGGHPVPLGPLPTFPPGGRAGACSALPSV